MPAKLKLIFTISALVVFAVFFSIKVFSAGPTCGTGGICSVLTTDGNGNFGISTSSVSGSRLYIQTGGTGATDYGLNIKDSAAASVFTVAGDGKVKIYKAAGLEFSDGTIQTTAATGGGVTSTPAGYITPGYFNSVAGTGGNYSFPASLSVGTSTAPSGGVFLTNGNMKTSGIITASNGFTIENSNYVFGSGAYNFFKPYMSSPSASSELSTAKSLYLNIDADGNETGTSFIFGHNANGSSATALMSVLDSGNVGVGTAAPQYQLEVFGASNKLGLTYSNVVTYGPIGGELSSDSDGNLHISAIKSGPVTTYSNIIFAEQGGKVGISTTTPTYPLTVAGVIHSSTGGYRFPDGTTQTTAATGSGGGSITTSSAVTAGYFPYWATGSSITGTSSIFQSVGNIGIGTTAPTRKLSIQDASTNSYLSFNTAGVEKWTIGNEGTVSDRLVIYGGSSPSYKFSILADGKVGIGTSTPIYPLDVRTTTAGTIFRTTNTTKSAYGETYVDSSGRAAITAYGNDGTTGGAYFSANGYEESWYNFVTRSNTSGQRYMRLGNKSNQFRIDSLDDAGSSITTTGIIAIANTAPASSLFIEGTTGNIGLGTASPGAKLQVAGQVKITGGSPGAGKVLTSDSTGLASWTTPAAGGGGYGWTTSGTSVILATTTNFVGIGTTTPAYKLDFQYDGGVTAGNYASGWLGRVGVGEAGTMFGYHADGTKADYPIIRAGGIGALGLALAGDSANQTALFIKSGGNVGIGTTTPAYPFVVVNSGITSLQVASSTVTIGGGTGKLNVGTIDPPYTINGEQYATYVSGMTGLKEETTGEIGLACNVKLGTCSAVINFGNEKKGSDLWLFAKTINLKNNFAKMTVLLTPSFDGKVWYEKDIKNSVLKIFGIPATSYTLQDTSLSVSYRLTAPRFDATENPNTRNDKAVPGLIINY